MSSFNCKTGCMFTLCCYGYANGNRLTKWKLSPALTAWCEKSQEAPPFYVRTPCTVPSIVSRVHPLSKKCNMPPIWSFHLKHSFLLGGCNGRFSGNFLREQECACAVQSLLRVSGFVAVEIELVTIVCTENITVVIKFSAIHSMLRED